MEKHLILECLKWNLNITTPYHLSDAIQGMGCLYWSDFEPSVLMQIRLEHHNIEESSSKTNSHKLVLFLI